MELKAQDGGAFSADVSFGDSRRHLSPGQEGDFAPELLSRRDGTNQPRGHLSERDRTDRLSSICPEGTTGCPVAFVPEYATIHAIQSIFIWATQCDLCRPGSR